MQESPGTPSTYIINSNTPVTFEALKETFRAKGQAQYIYYLDNITGPQGCGHWTLSTNHLAPNNLAPQICCIWEGTYRIQDAVLMQDYPPPTGANGKARAGIPTYPMTLLWYPRIRQDSDSWSLSSFSWAMAEKSLLPAKGSSPGFQQYSSLITPQGVPQPRRQRLRKLPRRLLHQSKQRQTTRQKKPTSVRSHRQSPAMNATTASFLGLRRRQRAQDLLREVLSRKSVYYSLRSR
jgi:hypothetical protein